VNEQLLLLKVPEKAFLPWASAPEKKEEKTTGGF
jgi:hypothetical protein